MMPGRIAPAKPSHLINVVEFQRKASEEGNRHECSDVASEEGSRGSIFGMIAGSEAPAKPPEASELPRPPEGPQAEALAKEISRLQGLAEFMEAQGATGEALAESFRAQLKDAKDKRAAAQPFPHQLRDAQKAKSPKSKNRPKNNPLG